MDELYRKLNDFTKNDKFDALDTSIKEDIIALLTKIERPRDAYNEDILIKEIEDRMN